MSCWIMSAEPVAKLAGWISSLNNMGYNYFGMDIPRTLRSALSGCCDKYGFMEAEKVYDALYALNTQAYAVRYGENILVQDLEEFPLQPYTENKAEWSVAEWLGDYYRVGPWHYRMLKRLGCFIYQCSEGNYEQSALYNGLTDLEHTLCAFIAENNEIYASAKWGE